MSDELESYDFHDEELTGSEGEIDKVLRPKSFDDFAGQPKVTDNLIVFVEAAKKRDESLDHVLLHGPPGGKQRWRILLPMSWALDLR